MYYLVVLEVGTVVEAVNLDHAIKLATERAKDSGYEKPEFKACYSRKAPTSSEDSGT